MGIFHLPRFIRRFIRRNTSQIPVERALSKRKTLSIIYAFVAWNLVGVAVYQIWSGRNLAIQDRKQSRWWHGNIYGAENVEIYKVKGFSLVKVEESYLDKVPKDEKTS